VKRRVLWVEDAVCFDLFPLAGPVYMSGGYDLVLADDVSFAITRIWTGDPFDAVIVGIRLRPGLKSKWQDLYVREGHSRISARLGMHLLQSLLGYPDAKIPLGNRPAWLKPELFGVFTAESRGGIGPELEKLGIRVYQQKRADLPGTILLEIIERILQQQS